MIYERPYNLDEIKEKYPEKIYLKLKNDPIHCWRAETGIDLIHHEPDFDEQIRTFKNWNLMPDELKRLSDEKSIEMFGMDNITHYKKIMNEYYDNDKLFYRENIKNATDIISIIMLEELDFDILNKKTMDIIEKNLLDDSIKIFRKKVLTAIKLFKEYSSGVYVNADLNIMKIIYSLLKFLEDENKYLREIGVFDNLNPNDMTNSQLKYEVVKLCVSYISKDLVEYSANVHHREIVKTAKGKMLY